MFDEVDWQWVLSREGFGFHGLTDWTFAPTAGGMELISALVCGWSNKQKHGSLGACLARGQFLKLLFEHFWELYMAMVLWWAMMHYGVAVKGKPVMASDGYILN